MLKVLIVDDEPIVRIGIKALGDWKSEGFCLDYEASNGKKALSILNEHRDVDILITDIDMPVMDGLELIKEVRLTFPHILILVLSAYSDYDLVRQSFKYGIFDYIKKSDMSYEKILEQLKNTKKEIIKYTQHTNYINELKEHEKNARKYQFQETLLTENPTYQLTTGLYCTLFIAIDNMNTVEKNNLDDIIFSDKILHIITNTLNPYHVLVDSLVLSKSQYVFLLSPQKKLAKISFTEHIVGLTKKLQTALKNYINVDCTAGISQPFTEQTTLGTSYQEAKSTASLSFFYGKGKIYTAQHTFAINPIARTTFSAPLKLYSYISINDYDTLQHELENRIILPSALPSLIPEDIYLYYQNILNILYDTSKNILEMESLLGTALDCYQIMLTFETLQQLNEWFILKLQSILSYMKQQSAIQINDFVFKAKDYVLKNYSDPDITIEKISTVVCISPTHFSTTFAKQTGERFHDYLIYVRINKAKELIEKTMLKDYEIAQRIGIPNSETFSRLFKKTVGLSPRAYRKQIH